MREIMFKQSKQASKQQIATAEAATAEEEEEEEEEEEDQQQQQQQQQEITTHPMFSSCWMSQAEDSILQVCQMTEFKHTKEWERYPNQFRRLYETFLPENVGDHCREWPAGKTKSEIKVLIQENSKPQDIIMYTDGSVTKDQ